VRQYYLLALTEKRRLKFNYLHARVPTVTDTPVPLLTSFHQACSLCSSHARPESRTIARNTPVLDGRDGALGAAAVK
jgi:hypothetical protein